LKLCLLDLTGLETLGADASIALSAVYDDAHLVDVRSPAALCLLV
jgi:hypothetical protein